MSTGNALRTFAYVYNPKSEPTSTLKVDTGYNFSENLFSKQQFGLLRTTLKTILISMD